MIFEEKSSIVDRTNPVNAVGSCSWRWSVAPECAMTRVFRRVLYGAFVQATERLSWNYRSLLQNIISFIGLFFKKDLQLLGRVLDTAFMYARVRLSCSNRIIYTGHRSCRRHWLLNVSTFPPMEDLFQKSSAKFFLRDPWGKPLLRGTQRTYCFIFGALRGAFCRAYSRKL